MCARLCSALILPLLLLLTAFPISSGAQDTGEGGDNDRDSDADEEPNEEDKAFVDNDSDPRAARAARKAEAAAEGSSARSAILFVWVLTSPLPSLFSVHAVPIISPAVIDNSSNLHRRLDQQRDDEWIRKQTEAVEQKWGAAGKALDEGRVLPQDTGDEAYQQQNLLPQVKDPKLWLVKCDVCNPNTAALRSLRRSACVL
jgi:hypothetical protein